VVLFEIGSHHVDQLFRGTGRLDGGVQRRVNQMHPYVIFHHFPHEAIDRASRRRERDPNTVEVYVARLRRKLGRDAIKTPRGLGYRLG
jgi:hypothetical protein